MLQKFFYERIKPELENRWILNEINDIQAYKKNHLGSRIGMNPFKFGLIVWDWNDEYDKLLRRMRMANWENFFGDDPLKYKKWQGLNNRNSFGIPFQYIDKVPNWSKSANWNDVGEIMGRFEPEVSYANSSANELSLDLIYYAESSKDIDSNEFFIPHEDWTLTVIERFALQLKSLTFPQYDGKYAPPVKMLLNIGNIFVDFPVVIKSITVEEGPPYEVITMRGMLKKITLEMRSAYPPWQAISATQVWTADTGAIFARQELQRIG